MQHDYDITALDANTGVSFRAAVNAALQALASLNSGGTAPATTYPYMLWPDTTSGLLKQRNGSNTTWKTIGTLDVDNWGLLPRSGGTMTGDIVLKGDPTANLHPATKQYVDARVPSGVIQMYGGAAAPSGWLLCDGSAANRTTYAALFAAIGTTFGVGDGSTTFNLPDMRGKVPLGAGQDTGRGLTDRALGAYGGEETHTLTTGEMPNHGHTATVNDPGHVHSLNLSGGDAWAGAAADGATTDKTMDVNSATTGITVSVNATTGGDGAHNNMNPFAVLNYIIKI